LKKLLTIFRRFSIAFRGLRNFQNGPRGLWQIKTTLRRFKTLEEASDNFQKVLNGI